jgi:putative nucleotidyltransferase with HDIG domain
MKRILLVDDDVEVLVDLRNQLTPLCPQWELSFAHNGLEALEALKSSRFDAILSDLAMRHMDGIELLKQVKTIAPGAVRIILSNVTEWNTGLQLIGVAHRYLPKPCQAWEIVETLNRAFALHDQLMEPRLRRLITQIPSLPSLPSLYMDLLSELRSERSSTTRVAEIISRDLGMSAKLLQLANSAFFGLSQQVTNSEEAVMFLGVATVQSLVLSMQIFSLFEKAKTTAFSFPDLWQHSWKTGLVARKIAESRHQPGLDPQECLTAGLLHDVGKLVLATSMRPRYEQVMVAAQQSGKPVWKAETEAFGSSHSEVGAYLLGLWGLPDSIVEAVAFHHQPRYSVAIGFDTLSVIHLANAMAPVKSPGRPERGSPLEPAYVAELQVSEDLAGWQNMASTLE